MVIDTTTGQYTQLLNGLATLRSVLAPRVIAIMKLPRDQQLAWLQRDPLLRRTIIMAKSLMELVGMELSE